MIAAQITSQPPSQAQTGQKLCKAITVQQLINDASIPFFATAGLVNTANTGVDLLQGDVTVTGSLVNGASLPLIVKYSFDNLTISSPGTYYIRVTIYKTTSTGAHRATQVDTNMITVVN
ncbi:hypothetical protein TARUN_5576 [Trichoderma arundinaceum]|uniref:Uncharacterized protein n=1 Tax=Trichoderma arundinaceum TaxID=490622 RepID=A0A395NKM7_TRIAR|nr:hypothetical protein TARUN_5576 [Trichoderma arundinaceum]